MNKEKIQNFLQGLSTLAKIGLGAAVLALLILLFLGAKKTVNKAFGRQTRISEVFVDELKKTQKLKVLTMYREVLVNEFKATTQTFGHNDDQLAIIYPARLDFGYDLESWNNIYVSNDTTFVTLPPIQILNKEGLSLDEANKRVPIQKGFWTAAEKASNARFAAAQMLLECEAEDCWNRADALGQTAIRELLKSFGAKNIVLVSSPVSSIGTSVSGSVSNPYTIKRGGDKLHYFKYANGAALMCTGDLNEEMMLRLANALAGMDGDDLMQVSLNKASGTTNVYYINQRLSKGSASALRHVRETSPAAKEREFKAIKAITGSDSLKAFEMDKDHNVMYTYPGI